MMFRGRFSLLAPSPVALVVLACLVACLATGTPADGGDFASPVPAGASYRLSGAGIAWHMYIPQRSIDSIREFYLVDEHIYGFGSNGWVWAIDAVTGERKWSQELVYEGFTVWPPVSGRRYQENTVVFTRLMDLSIRGLEDGMESSTYRFAKPSTGPVGITRELAVSSGVDRRIRAYHLDRGFTAWMVDTKGELNLPPLVVSAVREIKSKYSFTPLEAFIGDEELRTSDATAAAIRPPTVEFAEVAYFADTTGEVGAGYTADKFKLFITQVEGRPEGGLAVDDRHLYVATTEQWLYALDRNDGTVVWQRRLAREPDGPPIVAQQNLYIGLRGGGMERFDLGGEFPEVTPLNDCRMFLADWPARVAMLDNEGRVALFHKQTWTRAATLEPGRFDLAISNPLNDAVFVGTKRGELLCIRPANSLPLPVDAFLSEDMKKAMAHLAEIRKQEAAQKQKEEAKQKEVEETNAAAGPPDNAPAEAPVPERIEDRLLADPLRSHSP